VDFEEAADELYLRTSPGDFVARRKALAGEARAEGDAALARRIGALRRPTVSAWAVNLLAGDGGLDELAEVGEGLRRAWSRGEEIGEWQERRSRAVAEAARGAADLAVRAGQPLASGAQREVEETLEAVVLDADAARQAAAGRLDHPLVYVGFAATPVKAVPAKSTPARRKPGRAAEDPAARRQRLTAEAERAEAQATEAEQAAGEWAGRLQQARDEAQAAAEAVADLERELATARRRQRTADQRLHSAESEHGKARRTAEAARRRATEARHAANG
jgi:hypothetical protein